MSSEAYELLAMAMRYVFVLIGVLIVFRAYRWLRRDARAYRREIQALPDAGLVGEIVNLRTGEGQPLPREGTIGAARECDIRVKGDGVRRVHARFAFEEGRGLRITPERTARMLLGGAELTGPGYALHGTQLQIGDSLLRVRLFAGLKVPSPAAYPTDAYPTPAQEEDFSWEADQAATGFPPPYAVQNQGAFAPEEEAAPWAQQPPPGPAQQPYVPAQDYDGHYTEDGQMTWQYAYSLEDLRRAQAQQAEAQQAPPAWGEAGSDEGLPYQSPVPRHRRRSRR